MRILEVDHNPKYQVWDVRVLQQYANGAGKVFEFTFTASPLEPKPDPSLYGLRVYTQQSKSAALFTRDELAEAQNMAALHLHELLTNPK